MMQSQKKAETVSGWYTQFTKFFYPDDLYYSPNTSDTELLKYLTAHKNDDYIEDLEVKGVG